MKSDELENDGFTDWFAFHPEGKDDLLAEAPQSSGVYVVRRSESFGRFHGESDIVYIGSTRLAMRTRLRQYFRPGSTQATNQRINSLMQSEPNLMISWASAPSSGDVRSIEDDLLATYKSDHGEFPPLNRRR